MSWTQPPRAQEVNDAKTFVAWAQASLGVPYATVADMKILGKKAKELFERQPGTDWQTLVQVARWCQSKKRRAARVYYYVDQFRWAWADGAIELAIDDGGLAAEIAAALAVEMDRAWRSRLRRAEGRARIEVLEEWRRARS